MFNLNSNIDVVSIIPPIFLTRSIVFQQLPDYRAFTLPFPATSNTVPRRTSNVMAAASIQRA